MTNLSIRKSSYNEVKHLISENFTILLRISYFLACNLMPGMEYLAAVKNNQIVGALVGRRSGKYWEVVSVVVDKAYRKGGTASKLIRYYQALSKTNNKPLIGFVRRSNRASLAMVRMTGFKKQRVWTFPFGLEEILPWGDHFVWNPEISGKINNSDLK